MNHFDLFSLPAIYATDTDALERAYITLQRQFHPDRYVTKPAAERMAAAQKAMEINEAYHTLKTPLKRAQYMLALQGIRVCGENDNVKPCTALLMEVMELREAAEETRNPQQLATFQEEIKSSTAACVADIISLFEQQKYEDAAQATLRLSYLLKSAEEIRHKQLHISGEK